MTETEPSSRTRAASMWSRGDYATVGDRFAAAAQSVVRDLDVQDRDVLDVACGTGAAALEAARLGARSVRGVDATPEMLEIAQQRAAAEGLALQTSVGDLHDLGVPDGCADVVVSTFGVIFAEDVPAALAELRRATRPGGVIAITGWAADSAYVRVGDVLAPHMPEPPAMPPMWWTSAEGMRQALGDQVTVERRTVEVTHAGPDAVVAELARSSAPILMAREVLEGAGTWDAAYVDLVSLFAASGHAIEDRWTMAIPYLLAIETRH